MKKLVVCLGFLLLAGTSSADVVDFLWSRVQGLQIQPQDFADTNIVGFTAVIAGSKNGYDTLYANPYNSLPRPVFITKLKGVLLQSYTFPKDEYLNGFSTFSAGDTVYLEATGNKGTTSTPILSAVMKGIAIKTASVTVSGDVIHSFTANSNKDTVFLGFTESPLASEVVTWDCKYKNKEVLVWWTTEVELGNYRWFVERRKEQDTSYITLDEQFGHSGGANYQFADYNVKGPMNYYYKLIRISDKDTTSYGEKQVYVPENFLPSFDIGNNPSHFGETSIYYTVPDDIQSLRLVVYDKVGRLVRTIINGKKLPGHHKENWDGRDDTGETRSGVYFMKFELAFGGNKKFEKVEKIVVIK